MRYEKERKMNAANVQQTTSTTKINGAGHLFAHSFLAAHEEIWKLSRVQQPGASQERGERVRGGETAQSTERQREGASERERSGERRPEAQRYPSSMGSSIMGSTRAARRGGV